MTLAMLLRNRDRIMTERMKFDDILKVATLRHSSKKGARVCVLT